MYVASNSQISCLKDIAKCVRPFCVNIIQYNTWVSVSTQSCNSLSNYNRGKTEGELKM